MAGIEDHEFVFRFPDEESGGSRKKKSSVSSIATARRGDRRPSLRRQNSSGSRHSTKSARGSGKTSSKQSSALISASSVTPNPESRHDYERRNRSHTLHGRKSSSVLTKKLEAGFNLVSSNVTPTDGFIYR